MSSSSPPGSKVSSGSSAEADENSGPDEALGANISLSDAAAGLSEGIEGDSKDDNDADNDLLDIR